MDKFVLFNRLSEVMPDLEMITELRPSANDCVGWAQNAIEKIEKLMDDVLSDTDHKGKA